MLIFTNLSCRLFYRLFNLNPTLTPTTSCHVLGHLAINGISDVHHRVGIGKTALAKLIPRSLLGAGLASKDLHAHRHYVLENVGVAFETKGL